MRAQSMNLPFPSAWGHSIAKKVADDARRGYGAGRLSADVFYRFNFLTNTPAQLWQFYIQLVEIEAAFKTMKDDLNLRPIYHQHIDRIEAHIFVAFLAYCLHVTLRARLTPGHQ